MIVWIYQQKIQFRLIAFSSANYSGIKQYQVSTEIEPAIGQKVSLAYEIASKIFRAVLFFMRFSYYYT